MQKNWKELQQQIILSSNFNQQIYTATSDKAGLSV